MTRLGGSDCDYKNPRKYQPGELCWIIVSEPNYPAGRWKGEIKECTSGDYSNIHAVITDPLVESVPRLSWDRESYLGRSPTVYRVMPRSVYTDELMENIRKLENEIARINNRSRIREGALLDAIAVFKSK